MVGMRDSEIRLEAETALRRLRGHIRETPLEYSPFLSESTGAEVYLKLECQQITGSFKLRGAANKILSLAERAVPPSGVVTASSGNHAAAVAHALTGTGIGGVIYLPETVAKAKHEALKAYDVELRLVGQDSVVGELEAQKAAVAEGLVYVSPYSDAQVIGGQGTVALEIEKELPGVDAVLVPVGGGGLISGIGGALKARKPDVQIVGCQPERSHVMAASVREGRILELTSEPTLADGTAGGVDPEAITFPICARVVDSFSLVDEDDIARAMRWTIEKHYLLVEGAAALSIAALTKDPVPYAGKKVVLVVSGKKVSPETLSAVLDA